MPLNYIPPAHRKIFYTLAVRMYTGCLGEYTGGPDETYTLRSTTRCTVSRQGGQVTNPITKSGFQRILSLMYCILSYLVLL